MVVINEIPKVKDDLKIAKYNKDFNESIFLW